MLYNGDTACDSCHNRTLGDLQWGAIVVCVVTLWAPVSKQSPPNARHDHHDLPTTTAYAPQVSMIVAGFIFWRAMYTSYMTTLIYYM